MLIRNGTRDDLPDILRIYNHYVTSTQVSFDLEPSSLEARDVWFESFADSGPHRLLVAVGEGERLLGYACSTAFKPRPAYAVSVETSVYVDPKALGLGLGRSLMESLLDDLEGCGLHGAYAGIALPNDASVALHEYLGFRHVGTLREVGRKFDRYWDVAWFERRIGS